MPKAVTDRHYIMIGAPVTNVRTPPLLRACFKRLHIEARVEARHVDPDDLDMFMRAVSADDTVDGLLITMPHKKTIIPYLAAVSAISQRVGSVNSVKRLPSGSLVGAQFDGPALVNALHANHVPLATTRVLLVGAGGAGLSIAFAIATHGCASLAIADRDAGAIATALQILPNDTAHLAEPAYDTYDLLINATPLGMRLEDPSPFDLNLVARASWVADIVADPPRTRLQALAKQAETGFISGRDMVKGQIGLIHRWLLAPGLEQ